MDKLLKILSETGIPFTYDHFAEGESPEPPFICYLLPESNNFAADGIAYCKISRVHIELYTDRKDPAVEQVVEAELSKHGIFITRRRFGLTAKSCMKSFTSLKRRFDFYGE